MPTNTIINIAKKWENMYNFQKSQATLKNKYSNNSDIL